MAFTDFKYPDVVAELGLTERSEPDMFAGVAPLSPGDAARLSLVLGSRLGPAAHSEFARSVWMVGPLLQDVWSRYGGTISLNAGGDFDADPEARLTGFVDFAFSLGPQRPSIGVPVLLLFEAKRDSIPDGLGQAIAALVGAQRSNARRGKPVDPLHGCVTTGSLWRFLRLSGTDLAIDQREYGIAEADRLVGNLVHILGPPPAG